MSIRYILSIVFVLIVVQSKAQDYSPFYLGNEWVYNILEAGEVVGTDTMRCDDTVISGDTTFYIIKNYLNYTDGRPQPEPEEKIFLEGIVDPNFVFARTAVPALGMIDLLYFKHAYTNLETYSNLFFNTTVYYIGDYDLPSGNYKDCYWLDMDVSDSTGFIVAPDLGIVAAIEAGSISRTMKENNLPIVTSDELSLCDGDSVLLHSRYVKDEGIYRDTLSSSNGSDSIVLTTVTVLPVSESAEDVTICYGASYFAGGSDQTESGIYFDTLTNMNGCDSIVTTTLTVLPLSESSVDVTICEGESYFAGGSDQTESGIYSDTYTDAAGCDSTVTTKLTVSSPSESSVDVTICDGESYFAGGADQTESGIYTDTYTFPLGCDSTVITNLTVLPPSASSIDMTICAGESYFAGGADQTESGVYSDTYTNAAGCDSTVTTNLTVLPPSASSIDVTICAGESYFAGGADQTESGVYSDTYTNTAGCDSTVTTNLTVEVCAGSFPGSDNDMTLRVYPNPVSGILFIESATLEHIEIFDVFGKLIHTSTDDTFNFSDLSDGCYYLKCFHLNHDVSVRKVIHQK